ncbi:MAG TPA: metalloregulator ArsR/SmtB family transcription factor, partial [Candidatus Dormibacteraeota bacterium]|nr:metalloregulator ArsR/SmtB family transcription factor [Candidatus Dormibacteraeota bacterium]
MNGQAALRALAEPRRQEVLRLVRDEPRSVGEIAAHFDITQQAVSQHLQVLKEAGLVSVSKRGRQRLYVVRPDGLTALHEFIS